jgi:hypothetical protein
MNFDVDLLVECEQYSEYCDHKHFFAISQNQDPSDAFDFLCDG